MRAAHGIDLVSQTRFAALWERHEGRLGERLFHPEEIALYGGNPRRLASVFAAKEAVAKAYGLGFWGKGFSFLDIEIRKEGGQPCFRLLPEGEKKAAALGRLLSASLSISHAGDLTAASVVLLLEDPS